LFGQLFRAVHFLARSDEAQLRSALGKPLTEREAYMAGLFETLLGWPGAKALCRSPLMLLAQGISFRQRDRNLASHGTSDMLEVMWDFMRRFADADMERNWLVWQCVVGEFDHANPVCRPPFLRASHHERSVGASTQVAYHRASFLEVMRAAPAGSWSHYNFSDALDWMPDPVQREAFAEVVRTARPGAVLLNRSVDREDPVERLGLGDRLERLGPASEQATAAERSCLYRRVDLYRVRA
jgi:S-adenosylmethionine-diacylglycerol 3-amino-3-carboxypropyl transferase